MQALKYITNYFLKLRFLPSRRKKPYVINFPITDNCNSKCVMCNVWKDESFNELTNVDIEKVLSDELYRNVQHLGISGGEPSLRSDLGMCVESILKALPSLKSLSITTHAFNTEEWSLIFPKLKAVLAEYNIKFSINVSLDGIGEVHNRIRRIPNGFESLLKTLELFQKNGIELQFQCTVSKDNVYHVPKVLFFAKNKNIEVVFRVATSIPRLYNEELIPNVALNNHQKSFLADFFASENLVNQTKSISRKLYYRQMVGYLSGLTVERDFPCYFQNEGVFLTSHGDIYNCSVSTEKMGNALKTGSSHDIYWSKVADLITEQLQNKQCKTCIHDQSGAWSPLELVSFSLNQNQRLEKLRKLQKVFVVLRNYFVASLIKSLSAGAKPQVANKKIEKVMLIGAYGGEHVGDAAILGGVIKRISQRYGVEDFKVISFRKDRTNRWVDALNMPDINVQVIGPDEQLLALEQVDMVVYAGGPLMDLPVVLSGHYLTLARAYKKGKVIGIEGVGVGPLNSKISQILVSSILQISDVINVRTEQAKKNALSLGAENVVLGRDPAFDYLEYLLGLDILNEKKLPRAISEGIDEGCLLIGVNLRPLWAKYSKSELNLEDVENKYLEELASAMSIVTESCSNEVKFVFFPMNPDQYGFSDLETAYKLEMKLKSNINYYIVEYEPDIEEVMSLLKSLDAVVSMRFHGCIFSLSNNLNNVIGLDYQVGKKGKVTELMEDLKLNDNVISIESLQSEKLASTLLELLDK